jgi:hypothetical protein
MKQRWFLLRIVKHVYNLQAQMQNKDIDIILVYI